MSITSDNKIEYDSDKLVNYCIEVASEWARNSYPKELLLSKSETSEWWDKYNEMTSALNSVKFEDDGVLSIFEQGYEEGFTELRKAVNAIGRSDLEYLVDLYEEFGA